MFFLLLLVGVSGCGYALAGRGSFLPAHIRVIAIPTVENSTDQRLEGIITDRLRAAFIGRGKYKIVYVTEGANAVLKGELTNFQIQPVGLNEQQLGSRYLFTVVMKVTLIDLSNNEVLWSNDALTFREQYEIGGTVDQSFIDQKGPAVERLADDVARTVVTAITEAF